MNVAREAKGFQWSYLSGSDLKKDLVYPNGEVEYNGENRPICWASATDDRVMEMAYDRTGRCV